MKDNLLESHKSAEHDVLGKNLSLLPKKVKVTRYVTILYTNRVMELIKLNKICSETLKHFGMGMMFCYLHMLIFYYKYMNIVKNDVYKPNTMF
jgi:hypothetical protein